MVDGTSKNNWHYINIFCGAIDQSEKIYLINQVVTAESETAERNLLHLTESIGKFNITYDNVVMIISDAAAYNMKLKKLI